jgi:hypothetical protein
MNRVNYRKILIVLILLTVFWLRATAPFCDYLIIPVAPPLNPYIPLMQAVGMVETNNDTLAYNQEEQATGYFQIRPIRLKEYNRLTGNSYTLNEMYNYKISEEIFLYFADQIGPYDFEQIARKWNGSGRMTTAYWKRIKAILPR